MTLTVLTAVTHRDPYPFYADLVAERPFAHDPESGLYVAAGAAAVEAVLADPACRVRPPSEPVPPGIVGTPAGDVFGRLVRMTDGPLQTRLKRVVADALATVDETRVRDLAAGAAVDATDWSDVLFGVPTRVVAALCGLDAGPSKQAARLVGDFVRCIPAAATAQDQSAAAEAARGLLDLLGPRLQADDEGLLGELVRAATGAGWAQTAPLLANAVGLLSQTYDATAGLIGNTLLASGREGAVGDLPAFVDEVARYDAPVQNTRRFTVADTRIAGQVVPAGSAVLLLLAAANRDSVANPDPHVFRPGRPEARVYTFGSASHRCPGRRLATAITVGVVSVVREWPPPVHTGYRPSPNARIPVLESAEPMSPFHAPPQPPGSSPEA